MVGVHHPVRQLGLSFFCGPGRRRRRQPRPSGARTQVPGDLQAKAREEAAGGDEGGVVGVHQVHRGGGGSEEDHHSRLFFSAARKKQKAKKKKKKTEGAGAPAPPPREEHSTIPLPWRVVMREPPTTGTFLTGGSGALTPTSALPDNVPDRGRHRDRGRGPLRQRLCPAGRTATIS